MLSNACIVEIAVDDAADCADDEEQSAVPTTAETRKMLRLLSSKVECGIGDLQSMRCIEQLVNVFLYILLFLAFLYPRSNFAA